jgi:hypothetical protein
LCGADRDLITRGFQTVKYVTGSLIFVKVVKKDISHGDGRDPDA